MEKRHYTATIQAPPEKLWEVLWNKGSYEKWTSVFAEGSTVETDNWKKGSRVIFGDGKGNGMVSKVAENIPNEYMSFNHLGVVKDGVEELNKDWSNAFENYRLKNVGGATELEVTMDVEEDYLDYFDKTWPKALEKLKELAEN